MRRFFTVVGATLAAVAAIAVPALAVDPTTPAELVDNIVTTAVPQVFILLAAAIAGTIVLTLGVAGAKMVYRAIRKPGKSPV
jgi:hypothetical protein